MSTSFNFDRPEVKDGNWVGQAFFYRKGPSQRKNTAAAANTRQVVRASSAYKFSDTSLGGHRVINPPYGFTETADIVDRGLHKPTANQLAGSYGQGDYWSEAIDDNMQIVTFQFGVPKFNSLGNFFSSAYNVDLAYITNGGENLLTKISFNIGYSLAVLYTIPFQAVYGMYSLIKKAVDFATNTPTSKFYYMYPQMPLYWSTVAMLLNPLSVNMGFTAPGLNDKSEGSDIGWAANWLPDVYRAQGETGGTIDIFAVSSKYQRMADRYRNKLNAIDKKTLQSAASSDAFKGSLNASLDSIRNSDFTSDPTPASTGTLLQRWQQMITGSASKVGAAARTDVPPPVVGESVPATPAAIQTQTLSDDGQGHNANFFDYLKAELKDGGQFISFAVDANPEVTEGFNNDTDSSQIEEVLNGMADAARTANFNFANGNIGDNALANVVEGAAAAIGALVNGALSAVGLGGLASLNGAAKFDIPDMYTGSTIDMPTASFSITLGGPYADPFSVFQDQYVPLMCLIAGAIPRSTGSSTYTAPFHCSAFCQGRFHFKTAMINSLRITRFTGNNAQTGEFLPTRIKVDVEVVSMDKVMHMAMENTLLSAVTGGFFSEDKTITDYLMALSGTDLFDLYYLSPRFNRAVESTKVAWSELVSPARAAALVADTAPGKLVGAFLRNGDIN